jgi:hypothetical protein
MSNATLEWVDAETPHAKVLHESRPVPPTSLRDESLDIQAAIARIEQLELRVRREMAERPLVVVEAA